MGLELCLKEKDLDLGKARRELINEAKSLHDMRASALEWRNMWAEEQRESTRLKGELEEMKRELYKTKAGRAQGEKVGNKIEGRVLKRVQKSRRAKELALKSLRSG